MTWPLGMPVVLYYGLSVNEHIMGEFRGWDDNNVSVKSNGELDFYELSEIHPLRNEHEVAQYRNECERYKRQGVDS